MIIDTTLREGAQQFGTYFDTSIRKRIISGLARLGVEEIELGWVGQDGLEELAVWASKNVAGSALSVWTPCRDQDLRAAAALPVDRVNIGVPVSDAHITTRLGLDRRTLVERATKSVLAAKLAGIRYVSVGLEDLSRADIDFALSVGMAVKVMGASRLRLADSVGVLTPLEMADLVNRFRDTLDMDIAVHCHDDFGMGTGNGVAALAAGADYADGSLLGIGERSGIAKTEELAAWRELREAKGRYDVSGLRDLCAEVAEPAGMNIPRTKAVAGSDIFSCESGLHVHALAKDPGLFEPYDPGAVGASRRLEVGGKSGAGAVRQMLAERGVTCPESGLERVVEAVRNLSLRLRRPLRADELAGLVEG
jgi:homocitrate synthase NifV